MKIILYLIVIFLHSCTSNSAEPSLGISVDTAWKPKVVMESVRLRSGMNVILYSDSTWTYDNSVTVSPAPKTKKKISKKKRLSPSPTPVSNSFYSGTSENDPSTNYRSTTPSSYSNICGARTKKGGSCQRVVKGGGRCWQH